MNAELLICVTSELTNLCTKVGVITTVPFVFVTNGVKNEVLLDVTLVLRVCDGEDLRVLILDPTVDATNEDILTKVLLSVSLMAVCDVTVDKPWDKKHLQLQHSVTLKLI